MKPLSFAEGDKVGLDDLWTVNVKAPFRLIRLALPYLAKSGRGRVVLSHRRTASATAMHRFRSPTPPPSMPFWLSRTPNSLAGRTSPRHSTVPGSRRYRLRRGCAVTRTKPDSADDNRRGGGVSSAAAEQLIGCGIHYQCSPGVPLSDQRNELAPLNHSLTLKQEA